MKCFHSFILKYSPKRIGYKHDAYIVRVQLAYLDYNHHLGRSQLVTKNGKPLYTRKKNRHSPRWNVVSIPVAKLYSNMSVVCGMYRIDCKVP